MEQILKYRAKLGLVEGALSPEVIPLCAALAAQRSGDARYAIDLLREAVFLAEKGTRKKFRADYFRIAERTMNIVLLERCASQLPTSPNTRTHEEHVHAFKTPQPKARWWRARSSSKRRARRAEKKYVENLLKDFDVGLLSANLAEEAYTRNLSFSEHLM